MSVRRTVVLGDQHVLFLDQLADRVSRRIIADFAPHTILLNGDLLDLPSISRFKDADLYEDSIDREFAKARQYLESIRDENTKSDIEFKPANHEDRFPYYIAKNVPRLRRIRGMSIEEQLDLDRLHIKTVQRRYYIGGRSLLVKHGSYSGLNSCRKELMAEMCCGLSHHQHTNAMVSFSSLGRPPLIWYQIGCLCNLNPRYRRLDAHPSSWQQGMATIEADRHGVHVEPVTIYRGVAYWRGKRYEA